MGFELIDGKVPNEKLFYVPSYLMESLQAEDGKPDAQSSLLLEKRKEMASACPSFTVLLPWMERCMGVRCLELRDTEILLEEFVTGSATSTQVMARCDLLWKYYDQGEFTIKERSPMESAARWMLTSVPSPPPDSCRVASSLHIPPVAKNRFFTIGRSDRSRRKIILAFEGFWASKANHVQPARDAPT